jgi:hypothetical protein
MLEELVPLPSEDRRREDKNGTEENIGRGSDNYWAEE